MAQLWSLFVGARTLRPRGRRFSGSDDALLQRITTEHFPQGYTILEASGGWMDPDRRRFVREESRQILIACDSPRAVRRWARALGAALRQKELLVCRLGRLHRIAVPGGRR